MAVPDRYDACWIPGFDSGLDPNSAIERGLDWLDQARYPGEGVIIVDTKRDWSADALVANSGYEIVSPRSRRPRRGPARPVLALCPSLQALELAQRLALDGGLCVIPGTEAEIGPWIIRTGATNLIDHRGAPAPLPAVDDEVSRTVEHIVWLVGHKVIAGDEKTQTVRALRVMLGAGHRPPADALVAHAVACGGLSAKALGQLRDLYEQLLAGRSVRDHAGRAI